MSLAPWPSRRRGAAAIDASSSHASSTSTRLPSPSPPSAATGRKRPRIGHERQAGNKTDRNTDDEPVSELTDVAAALSLLVQRFHPSHNQGQAHTRTMSSVLAGCPVVLHHQFYTVLDNHTAVDVELEELRRRNFVRLLRLLTLRRDVGVVLTSTYVARVQAALDGYAQQVVLKEEQQQQQVEQRGADQEEENAAGTKLSRKKRKKGTTSATSKPSPQDMVFVFTFFLQAIDTFTSLSVTRCQLEALLAQHITTLSHQPKHLPRTAHFSSSASGTSHHSTSPFPVPHPTTDQIIRALLHAGFLARRVDAAQEEEAYWFSAPELGRVTASLPEGRKAILAALRRSRYKELSERNLGALNLMGTVLSLPFHVADLVGSKEVLAMPTASGLFLKLPQGSWAEGGARGAGTGEGRGRRT